MTIDAETLKGLDHRRLQALAKEYGLKANQKKTEIIEQILVLSEQSSHWELSAQTRLCLIRVPGFSRYFDLFPIGEVRRGKRKAAEAQQVWDTLKLGVPLCYLFNMLPDEADIAGIDTTPENTDVKDVEHHRVATAHFLAALRGLTNAGMWHGGAFSVADLYHDKAKLDPKRVLRVIIKFVELLPPPGHNCHIHDLPAELLSRIFKLLITPELGECPIQPCSLLLVCRRWYDLATPMDGLWTNIFINEPLTGKWGRPTKSALRIALSIKRSQGKDLSLVFKAPKPERRVDIEYYLAGGLERITRYTVVKQPHTSHPYITTQIQGIEAMPRLHTLILIQSKATDLREHDLISHPTLQTIQVYDTYVQWSSCAFPELRTLEISETRFWNLWMFQDFAALLRGMPLLERLIIRIQSGYASADGNVDFSNVLPADMLHLATLELAGLDTHIIHYFLHFLHAPHLRRLRLVGNPEDPRPTNWSRSRLACPELETLTMQGVTSTTTLYHKLSLPATTEVDIYITHDPNTELPALEAISSPESLLCKRTAGSWECGHAECEALPNTAADDEAIRWQTHPTPAAS